MRRKKIRFFSNKKFHGFQEVKFYAGPHCGLYTCRMFTQMRKLVRYCRSKAGCVCAFGLRRRSSLGKVMHDIV